ncbi:MAG: nucleoside hydrolase [Actinomycetaceae bacterium]|nr:nucleoside hydrolase [Actinomycetaceae bacterium]
MSVNGPTRVPFILDTDSAQDDCVAILFGLLDPVADMRAITMVAGNVGFEEQVRNAAMTLAVADRLDHCPIHRGCTQPLTRAWASASDVHGDGAGGMTMCIPEGMVSTTHAVDAMLELTSQHPGEISLVCIGPLTNVAAAVIKDRSFVERVKSVYIMGGSNNGRGNITAAAEFNFYVDPEAAQIVFEAGFANVVVVTWDPLTLRDGLLPRSEYEKLTQLGTPLARFFKKLCDHTLAYDESVGVPGSTHPDSLTLACLLHPELIVASSPYRVDVETSSELTRGYSNMQWDKFDAIPNAHVVEAADSKAFFARLRDLLSTATTPALPITGLDV